MCLEGPVKARVLTQRITSELGISRRTGAGPKNRYRCMMGSYS